MPLRHVLLASLCCFSLTVASGPAWCLPATGISACFNSSEVIACPQAGQDFYGQDGNYQSGSPMTFQDNGNGTVTDLVTGLIWQKADDGTRRNWSGTGSYCLGLSPDGMTGWRAPTRRELLSIMDKGVSGQIALDPVFSSSGGDGVYWSGTAQSGDATAGWAVNFAYGTSYPYLKTYVAYARCVRGAALPASGYIDNGNGTIGEEATGLVWETAGTTGKSWKDALAWCEGSETAGLTDWRLPNIRELEYLVDDGHVGPAIDPHFIEVGNYYWSGSPSVGNVYNTWRVDFYSGSANSFGKSGALSVRCVRGATQAPVATLTGVPPGATSRTSLDIAVGGTGVVAYRYMIDGGPWSVEEAAVSVLIQPSGLAKGAHAVSVIGKDAGGNWQPVGAATTASWTVIAAGDASSLLLLLLKE